MTAFVHIFLVTSSLLILSQLDDTAGTQSSSAQLDELDGIVEGGDAAGSLHLYIGTDVLGEQLDVSEGGASLGETGGGLDVVSASLGHQLAHGDLLLVGQQAGLDDNLQDLVAAGSLQGLDLVQDLVMVAGLQIADIDHHIDLVSAVGDSVLGLELLHSGGVVAVGEADNGADSHLVTYVLLGSLYEGRRDAYGSSAVSHSVVTDHLDLFPYGSLSQQGVVNFGINFFSIHDIYPFLAVPLAACGNVCFLFFLLSIIGKYRGKVNRKQGQVCSIWGLILCKTQDLRIR